MSTATGEQTGTAAALPPEGSDRGLVWVADRGPGAPLAGHGVHHVRGQEPDAAVGAVQVRQGREVAVDRPGTMRREGGGLPQPHHACMGLRRLVSRDQGGGGWGTLQPKQTRTVTRTAPTVLSGWRMVGKRRHTRVRASSPLLPATMFPPSSSSPVLPSSPDLLPRPLGLELGERRVLDTALARRLTRRPTRKRQHLRTVT